MFFFFSAIAEKISNYQVHFDNVFVIDGDNGAEGRVNFC